MNRAGIAQLETFFEEQGLRYLKSWGNFILVKVGAKAGALNQELLRRGVIVRPVASYGLPDWLRVSIGTQPQNKRFIDAFIDARRELR